jgi:DNA-binding response OmpR family regulator
MPPATRLDEAEASAVARWAAEALLHLWWSSLFWFPRVPLSAGADGGLSCSSSSCRRREPRVGTRQTRATGASFCAAVLLLGVDEQRLILVAEDDEATAGFLAENLVADGFRVARAAGAGEVLRAIEVRHPALVLLDLRLEVGSGLDVLDRIRTADGLASRIDPDLPVIVLTGRAGEADRVRSFDRGADDHICKPFLYAELLARVRAVLRRAEGRRAKGVLRVRDLTIDPTTRIVRLAGSRIELSAKEFALLHALAVEPTRVYRKQELLRDVWGYLAAGNTRTLDAHASRLRKKLGASRRPWVVNVRGVGYKLTEAP